MTAAKALGRGERFRIACLAVFFVGFGCIVEMRACFLRRPMTDAGCFFRGAWALRTGHDPYEVTDDNGWHFNYPPTLGIVMMPFADAPAGADRGGLMPYPASVALWYVVNVALLLGAVHWLACAVERSRRKPHGGEEACGGPAWWRRRIVSLIICLPPAAHTLMRGQVNFLILICVVGMLAAWLDGQRFRAGLWLSGAVAVKVFPAFLFVVPLWKRDWRMLGGGAVGLTLTLGAVPLALLGPERTLACYRTLAKAVLVPGLAPLGADESRARELTNVTATGSQSLVAVLHNTLYRDHATRPDQAAIWVRLTAVGTAGALTLLALVLGSRSRAWDANADAPRALLAWGLIIVTMLMASPVSHMHYFCLLLPLVAALDALTPAAGATRHAWVAVAGLFMAAYILPHLPGLFVLREVGLMMYAVVAMWIVGLVVLMHTAPPAQAWEIGS